jgi:hypothetical protein
MRAKVVFLTVVLYALVVLMTAAYGGEKVVYTTDGEKYIGTIHSQDDKFITLKIKGGTARIPKSIIKKIVDYVEEAHFQLLVVHNEKLAKRLHEELRYGADFTKLVEKYSEDISFFDDGKTGFVDKTYLPKNVSDIAFILPRDRFTNPLKVGDAFYIVKVLEKRKVERDPAEDKKSETPEGQGDIPSQEGLPHEGLLHIRIAVLPVEEKTREAEVASLGSDIQELLASDISETTGLEAFTAAKSPKPDDKNAPKFVITGEVARSGPAYAVQFILKDSKGRELFTTDRLTAVCPGENIDDLLKAIKQLAESLVREIHRPR